MNRPAASTFLSIPKGRRALSLLAAGAVLIAGAYGYRVYRSPSVLRPQETAVGLIKGRDVLGRVQQSEFGRTERGRRLTDRARSLLDRGGIRFSDSLGAEALCVRYFGGDPVLYVGVIRARNGIAWPSDAAIAKRIFHESLHLETGTASKSKEEECDAFCAAEEAAAAVMQREARYPVKRDGRLVWKWVQRIYKESASDPKYQPVGYMFSELAEKTGITNNGAEAKAFNSD